MWSSLTLAETSETKEKPTPGFKVSTFVDNTDVAITLAFSSDGRLFYLEKNTGKIRIVIDGKLRKEPWATIEVDPTGERGLLGLAFDPYFRTNGFVYFYHSVKDSQYNRIVRLRDVKGKGVEMTHILEIPDHVPATNHNGGNITFGPNNSRGEAYLYISVGDGGGRPGRSQENTNLLGKILKINVRGLLPITYHRPYSIFYAKGLRNSFDLAFNPINEVLYATENGPIGRDEINKISEGGNYGWPLEKGLNKNNVHTNPLWDFGIISVAPTGITFYPTDGNFPYEYKGNMFVSDYNNGRIYRIKLSGEKLDKIEEKDFHVWLENKIKTLDPEVKFADITVGPNGAIYLAGFSKIIKIEYSTGTIEDRKMKKFN